MNVFTLFLFIWTQTAYYRVDDFKIKKEEGWGRIGEGWREGMGGRGVGSCQKSKSENIEKPKMNSKI